MQERATQAAGGVSIAAGAAARPDRTCARPARTSKRGAVALATRPAVAARGARPHRLARHRRGRPSTAGCASRSSPPATSWSRSARRSREGEIYDSNRYTLHGMLDAPRLRGARHGRRARRPDGARAAFAEAAASADVVITSGGVSVGEADFVKALLDKLGEVVFWKIAMKPGRPLAYGTRRRRALLRPAGQPGLGDGDVLPVRARRAADADRGSARRAGADVPGAAARRRFSKARAAPSSSAASSRATPTARWSVRVDRRAGLGHPALDVARPTASSSCGDRRAATSSRATSSRCSCSRGWSRSGLRAIVIVGVRRYNARRDGRTLPIGRPRRPLAPRHAAALEFAKGPASQTPRRIDDPRPSLHVDVVARAPRRP